MNDAQGTSTHQEDRCNTLPIQDMGAASELTRGMALITPWFENAIPPYNYWFLG